MRWEICFNLSTLRMLSFALDLHRRRLVPEVRRQIHGAAAPPRPVPAPLADSPTSPAAVSACWRRGTAFISLADYSLIVYLAHVFYPPLYLAGPIITFQDFAWQLRQRPRPLGKMVCCIICWSGRLCPPWQPEAAVLPMPQVTRYAARFAADWACLELVTHLLCFNSIAKHRIGLLYKQHGLRYGASEMGACIDELPVLAVWACPSAKHNTCRVQSCAALTAFWVLCFMWLKFATIWRFCRRALAAWRRHLHWV